MSIVRNKGKPNHPAKRWTGATHLVSPDLNDVRAEDSSISTKNADTVVFGRCEVLTAARTGRGLVTQLAFHHAMNESGFVSRRGGFCIA